MWELALSNMRRRTVPVTDPLYMAASIRKIPSPPPVEDPCGGQHDHITGDTARVLPPTRDPRWQHHRTTGVARMLPPAKVPAVAAPPHRG
uniref:Uncharacterized protein n=1 Tax=Rhizophora mucronata TaxID=61149 RepID=A0A2P2J095_RHIMU